MRLVDAVVTVGLEALDQLLDHEPEGVGGTPS